MVRKHYNKKFQYVRITNQIVTHIRRQPQKKVSPVAILLRSMFCIQDEDGEFLPPHMNEKKLDTWYSEQVQGL